MVTRGVTEQNRIYIYIYIGFCALGGGGDASVGRAEFWRAPTGDKYADTLGQGAG